MKYGELFKTETFVAVTPVFIFEILMPKIEGTGDNSSLAAIVVDFCAILPVFDDYYAILRFVFTQFLLILTQFLPFFNAIFGPIFTHF